MPLATNPSKTLPVWLACDAEIPMAERPVFLVRFLTRHEINAHCDELEEIRQLTDMKEAHRRIDAMLARSINGWRHMTEPGPDGRPVAVGYAPDRFDRVLHPPEKWELANLIPEAPRLTDEEKKSSSSPPPSAGESSAPPAPKTAAPRTSKRKN